MGGVGVLFLSVGSGRSRLTRATGLARSRALAAECALRCLHPLTELGSHLTVVPEVVAEPGVPANAALVVAATLEVQLVGGFKQRVQLDRRGRGGGPLSAALALRVALVFATALSLGFAFVRCSLVEINPCFLVQKFSWILGLAKTPVFFLRKYSHKFS